MRNYLLIYKICLSEETHVRIVYTGPLPIPLTALPVAVGDSHHDEDDGEEEEDEAGEAVDDGGGGRDGDRGLRHHGDTWQPETISIRRGSASFLFQKFDVLPQLIPFRNKLCMLPRISV